MQGGHTSERLLDAAHVMVQKRGYNAFSYKDLAEVVGIRTASIHYHFKAKADLGKALMDRYLAGLHRALAAIDDGHRTSVSKLESFVGLYRMTETSGAICLCGSLASDLDTLPGALQQAVAVYLRTSEAWVATTIRAGVAAGELGYAGDADEAAATLVASLQGGLIMSRTTDGSVLDMVQRVFVASLRPQ